MNAVLATDMTQHMRLLDAFSEGRSEQPNLAAWRDSDVLLQLVLHTADLCNPCRPLQFSIKWGELICCEFLEQVSWLTSARHMVTCLHHTTEGKFAADGFDLGCNQNPSQEQSCCAKHDQPDKLCCAS